MSDPSLEKQRSKLADDGAVQEPPPQEPSASNSQPSAWREFAQPVAAVDPLVRPAATQAEKELLTQAIMPYVALLNDMIQKQAERIERLEDQVKALQQD